MRARSRPSRRRRSRRGRLSASSAPPRPPPPGRVRAPPESGRRSAASSRSRARVRSGRRGWWRTSASSAVRDDVDDPERPEHGARREQERDRHRPRQPEDEQQHEQRDRQRDRLALLEVLARRSGRGRAGSRARRSRRRCAPGGMAERAEQVVGVALRVGEVQRRDDVAVEDPSSCGNRAPCPSRSGPRAPPGRRLAAAATRVAGSAESRTWKTTVNAPSLRSPKCFCRTSRTCSESVPGHREHVRLQRREPSRGPAADEHDDEPRDRDRPAQANHRSRPGLDHVGSSLPGPQGYPRDPCTSDVTSIGCTRSSRSSSPICGRFRASPGSGAASVRRSTASARTTRRR